MKSKLPRGQTLLRAVVPVVFLLNPAWTAAQEWHPPEPVPNEKDWVQLSSGEWIRGTIDLFRDLKMEFDSEDLDDLVIDWEDVAGFRSPRILTYVFTGQRVVTGTASMRDGTIRITSNGEDREFSRRELLSIIEGSPSEINYWSAKASIGVTARAGNTDQADVNTIVKIKREATKSRLNLGYQGNFGEVGGERTIDNHRASADFSFFVSRRFFLTPAWVDSYFDEFQNIDYRTAIGAGGGYYLYRQSEVDWSVSLGAGYRFTRFVSVEAGEDLDEDTGSIIPVTQLDWDITGDIEVDLTVVSQVAIPDPKLSTHHATLLLTIDFFRDIFELSSSLTWDRVESPKANEDGTVPERDDLRLTFGFAVDL